MGVDGQGDVLVVDVCDILGPMDQLKLERLAASCVSGVRFSIGHKVASGKKDIWWASAQKCEKYRILTEKIFENICERRLAGLEVSGRYCGLAGGGQVAAGRRRGA